MISVSLVGDHIGEVVLVQVVVVMQVCSVEDILDILVHFLEISAKQFLPFLYHIVAGLSFNITLPQKSLAVLILDATNTDNLAHTHLKLFLH